MERRELYQGKLGSRIMQGEPHKAYTSWRGQRERCNYKKNKAYKHYGAKGVRVIYTAREFVTWWLRERDNFPASTKVTVNRLDPMGDYCFENIEMVPWSENVAEANARTKITSVESFDLSSGKTIEQFPSCKAAGAFYGKRISFIYQRAKLGVTSPKTPPFVGFRFTE